MAVTLNKYTNATLLMATGRLDLRDTNIKVALVTADYTPDMDDHTTFSDVAANELDEYSNYTPGGIAITGATVIKTGAVVTWDGAPLTYIDLDGTFKYGVIYLDGTVGVDEYDEVIDPLIALIDFDDSSTVASLTIPGVDFIVPWNEEGIMDFGPCAEVCA